MYYKAIQKILSTIFILLVLITTGNVSAAVFIVDDNYDGVNNTSACEQTAGAIYSTTITNARLSAATNTTALPHTIRVCPGSYTEDNTFNDPEFIGMSIEGTSGNPSDVQVNNSNVAASVFFLRQDKMSIKNLSVNGGRFGIRTLNSISTQMDNLILNKQVTDGILVQSGSNQITNTHVENSGRFGIFYTTAGDTLTIQSTKVVSAINTCIYSNRGNETLIDVTVDDCGSHGILMLNAAGQPENLTLSNINISNTVLDGLYIRNYDASAATDNVNITDVKITNSKRFGIYSLTNDGINLSNILVDTTTNDGIFLNNTDNSTFANLSIDNAGSDGLYFNGTTANNSLKGVSISNSTAYGHYSNGGDNNTLEKLIVSDSSGNAGIFYGNQANNNIVKGYESYNNKVGVYLSNSISNVFANGLIYSNNEGVRLITNASLNEFVENYIHDNSLYGLLISASGTNQKNAFTQNCFINPSQNINNQETGVNNIFDNGTIGNFYGSNPAGSGYSETCLDADTNAICDAPYTIPTSASGDKDNFPSRDLSYIDAACFSDAIASPDISFQKTSNVVSDPVNGNANPKAIPGAIVNYTLTATNSGIGIADNDTVVIVDQLPNNIRLVLGLPLNPAIFTDGTPSSGLSFTFAGLNSTTDDIQFSNNGGTTFITPSVDANGIDISSPPINFLQFSPKGVFNSDTGSGSPNFSISYQVEVN